MAIVRTKATRSVTWWVGVTIFAIAGFAMIVGRLEVFTVLVLLTPAFWRE